MMAEAEEYEVHLESFSDHPGVFTALTLFNPLHKPQQDQVHR